MTRQDTKFVLWLEELERARVRWATAPRDLKAAMLLSGPALSEAEGWLHARKEDLTPEQRDFVLKSVMHRMQERMREREAKDRALRDTLRWWVRFGVTVTAVVILFGLEFAAINLWHKSWVEPEITRLVTDRARTRTAAKRPATVETAAETGVAVAPEPAPVPPPQPPPNARLSSEQRTRFESYLRMVATEALARLERGDRTMAVLLALETAPGSRPRIAGTSPHAMPPEAISVLYRARAVRRATALLTSGTDVLAFDLGRDGRHVLYDTARTTGQILDLAAARTVRTISSPGLRLGMLAADPAATRFVTITEDETAALWDGVSGRLVARLDEHEGPVVLAAFAHDGAHVLTAAQDATVRVWSAATGRRLAILRGHDAAVTAAAFSPDGRRIASASEDKSVRLWDAESGRELAVLAGHQGPVTQLAFIGRGERLLTVSYDGTARIWDAARGSALRVIEGTAAAILAATASADGRLVLVSTASGHHEVRDTASSALIAQLADAPPSLRAAEFSADGRHLLTLSIDGTLHLWSVPTGELVALLNDEKDPAEAARFGADGGHVTVLGRRGGLVSYGVPASHEALIADALRSVPRCLTFEERDAAGLLPMPPDWCQSLAKLRPEKADTAEPPRVE